MPHITGLPSTHPLPCACTLRSFRRQRLSNFAASSLPARGCGTKHNPFRVYSDITSAKLRTRSRQLFAIDSDKSGFETFQSGSAGRQVLDWVNDSVKWVVTLAAAFVLLRYHNVWVNWCLVGSIVAALTCKILKKLINKQRPAYARKQDPGMPSSHATSLSYLAAYMMITLSKPTEILLTLGSALFLISLRVTLGYHSIAQVCAGAGLGIGVAAVWHQLGQQYMFQFIDTSQHGETVLSAITWTAGVLFLVRVIAKGANTSLAATEPGTQE